MTGWIDVLVYSGLLVVLAAVAPRIARAIVAGLSAARNPEWAAPAPEGGQQLELWCRSSAAIAIVALIAVVAGGFMPAPAGSAVAEVLQGVASGFAAGMMLPCAIVVLAGARRARRTIPLPIRRTASLARRTIGDSVPRRWWIGVAGLSTLHLVVWPAAGLFGIATGPAFPATAASAIGFALIFLLPLRAAIRRPPGPADAAIGPGLRRGQVRAALALQLYPAAWGFLRLYQASSGAELIQLDRAIHLLLVAVMALALVRHGIRLSPRRIAGAVATTAIWLGAAIGIVRPLPAQEGIASIPPDDSIRRILTERIDAHRQSIGIVVGIIEPSGRRVVAAGTVAPGGQPVTGESVFELASVTKSLTALLLADAVRRGEVQLDDPITRYLPGSVELAERGRPITLEDLALHFSGLPREPGNLDPADPANPFADYTVEQLYAFLESYRPLHEPGSDFEYSSLGYGLLGHLLSLRTGESYDALLRERITGPLGMKSTGLLLTPEMRSRLAGGHDRFLRPTPNWDSSTLAGAGGVRSTAVDMLTLLDAVLRRDSPLSAAATLARDTRRPSGSPAAAFAMGSAVLQANGTEIYWSSGRSGGYRTWLGYEPKLGRGVVVLTNADGPTGPDDIGLHLLNSRFAIRKAFPAPPAPIAEARVEPAEFDRVAGRYQLAPASFLAVSRKGNRFVGHFTGQPPFELFATSLTDYFMKTADVLLSFELPAEGPATAVQVSQGGGTVRGVRITREPRMPEIVTLDSTAIERLVGRYQVAPGLEMRVARRRDRVFVQFPRQPPLEVFPSSERSFFAMMTDFVLTFEFDGANPARAVIVRQGPSETRAPRAP